MLSTRDFLIVAAVSVRGLTGAGKTALTAALFEQHGGELV